MAMSPRPAGEGSEIPSPSRHYGVVECWSKCGTEQMLNPNDIHICVRACRQHFPKSCQVKKITQQFVFEVAQTHPWMMHGYRFHLDLTARMRFSI